MGQVVVTVNGREFALSCGDGQETRIRRLAQYVDMKVGEFAKQHGQIGDSRLILLAAIVIADELSDTNEILQRERSRAGAAGAAAPAAPAAQPERTAAAETSATNVRGIAQRIETIAARMESS